MHIEFDVMLSTAIQKTLNAYNPDFALWKQSDYPAKYIRPYKFSLQSTPAAVIGDFNGDGKIDAVLAGHDTHGPKVLAVVSSDNSAYVVTPIKESTYFHELREKGKSIPRLAFDILHFQPKGKVYELGESAIRKVILQTDAFEKAALDVHASIPGEYYPSLYWWDESKKGFLESGLIDPSQ